MNMEHYEIACDVILEQRNEVQQTIDNMLMLYKNGKLDSYGLEFQDSIHFLHEKRNDLDFAYEQLTHAMQCKEVEREVE